MDESENAQGTRTQHIGTYKELRVYKNEMEAAMEIFCLTKSFPVEERFSYDIVLGQLVRMISEPRKWTID